MPDFATCSFAEYRDHMGGIPVRTANGVPKFKLNFTPSHGSLLPTLPATYPKWPLVQAARKGMPGEDFAAAYRHGLEQVGIEQILADAEQIIQQSDYWSRVFGRQVTAESPLVLLCFEQLHKPGEFCHRSEFARFVTEHTGRAVAELGRVRHPEIAAEVQQEGLF